MAFIPPVTYAVVLVPVAQVSDEGCKPGFVKLTGTPGEGSWEEWGPYRAVGEMTSDLASLAFGVPAGQPGGGAVPSPS